MGDVTQLLVQMHQGDPNAAENLLTQVYDELRRLAAHKLRDEPAGQTLQATALVHEAWMRLVKDADGQSWNGRGHFFGAAAEAMRRILVEQARYKRTRKRGGGAHTVPLGGIEVPDVAPGVDLLALNDVLERLEAEDPVAAQVVKLRYFAGLTIEETAQALDVSVRTANRQWVFAKAWLMRRLSDSDERKVEKPGTI